MQDLRTLRRKAESTFETFKIEHTDLISQVQSFSLDVEIYVWTLDLGKA